MATDLPYMPAVGNIGTIFQRIRGAGTPPKFTIDFLKSSLGFNASQDRSFPRILKQLRFLNPDGTPLARYNEFKSSTSGGSALAQGLREGWAPIFLADQLAHTRSVGELKEVFKTVTGQGDAVAKKMASTFKAIADAADWTGPIDELVPNTDTSTATQSTTDEAPPLNETEGQRSAVNLHHDVHVHLPPTSDVSIYRAIFRALREELL